jgi:AcrR family transcriptional regulator
MRTRVALTRAAAELMREGRPPSMPEAADRALVSIATAYRYFTTAEELWEEAAVFSISDLLDEEALERAIEAAGDDVDARLEVVVRRIGWNMLDKEVPYRQMAKTSLDRWFAQQRNGGGERRPTRPGRRNRWNALAVEPLRGTLTDAELAGLIEALGLAWGTESMIALYDVLELEPDAAKQRMLTTCRWILRGALADAGRGSEPQ